MTKRNLTPMFLSALLITLICIFSVLRLKNQVIWKVSIINFDIVFASVYIIWILFESKVSKQEIDKGNKTSDFGTCELYALGQGSVIISALWFNSIWNAPNTAHFFGFFIFIFGLIIRGWAIITLGRYYSHIVREVDRHIIIDTGPYRYIRHPAYAGMVLANTGIVLFFFNTITFSIFLLILIPAIILRIAIEEKTLYKIEGYSEFAKSRKRIIPALW